MALLGKYNAHFLSAVGNVLYPFTIMISFLTALSTGATVLIAHSVGGRAFKSARRFAEVSFFYNLAIAIPLFLVLLFGARTLMTLMGASGQIKVYGIIYMSSLSYSVLFMGVELSIAAILQGVGKTRYIMYAAILRTITNILLDWILIYGHWGFPELGIEGAAIATSISNLVAMVYYIISFSASKRLPFIPTLSGIMKPRWSIQKNNIKVGLPFGLEAIFWTFGQIIIIRMVNELDDYAAGVYILITRIQSVTFFFYLGIARATMTLVGQQLGSGNRKLALKTGLLSLRYSLFLCVLASLSFIFFPEQILHLFTNDQELIAGAVFLMYIISITIFPVSVNVVIGNAIRGMKDTKWMFYTQSFGTIFTISVSSMMLFVFHMGLKGVFITVLFDECIRAGLNFWRFRTGKRPKIKLKVIQIVKAIVR